MIPDAGIARIADDQSEQSSTISLLALRAMHAKSMIPDAGIARQQQLGGEAAAPRAPPKLSPKTLPRKKFSSKTSSASPVSEHKHPLFGHCLRPQTRASLLNCGQFCLGICLNICQFLHHERPGPTHGNQLTSRQAGKTICDDPSKRTGIIEAQRNGHETARGGGADAK